MTTVKIKAAETRPEQVLEMSDSRAAKWVESGQAEYYESRASKASNNNTVSSRV